VGCFSIYGGQFCHGLAARRASFSSFSRTKRILRQSNASREFPPVPDSSRPSGITRVTLSRSIQSTGQGGMHNSQPVHKSGTICAFAYPRRQSHQPDKPEYTKCSLCKTVHG
jgi:hypothetical protein